jgi:phage tail-like protein
LTDDEGTVLCNGAFAECDGLEMNLKVRTIREGGNNNQVIHLLGQTGYGQLTLKRGMTSDFGLWTWFDRAVSSGYEGSRLNGRVALLSSEAGEAAENAVFVLTGCLPTKIKAPPFQAKDGQIAIEEMQIAYERLQIENPNA